MSSQTHPYGCICAGCELKRNPPHVELLEPPVTRPSNPLVGTPASPNRAEAIADLLDVAADLSDHERGLAADALRDYARLKRSTVETDDRQAPIARVIVPDGVAGGAPLQVELYDPGLPPGEHDLYCEPSAQEWRAIREHELRYIEKVLVDIRKQDGEGVRESADDTLAWLRSRMKVSEPERCSSETRAVLPCPKCKADRSKEIGCNGSDPDCPMVGTAQNGDAQRG